METIFYSGLIIGGFAVAIFILVVPPFLDGKRLKSEEASIAVLLPKLDVILDGRRYLGSDATVVKTYRGNYIEALCRTRSGA